MSRSNVFFIDLRASARENLLAKVVRLADRLGLERIIPPRSLVAIKLHFGEKGNTAYIRPTFVRALADRVRDLGAFPFVTDANTLYAGTRSDSVSHFRTAVENGFSFSVVNAPLIIADGLRGGSYATVPIEKELLKTAYVAQEIAEADCLISLAHFKGHELSGFGGTLKNLGMGCAARRGKMVQHADVSPRITRKKCIGCGACVEHCSQSAIALKEGKAVIDPKKCIGCGECILICPNEAIDVHWNADMARFQKKMAEYAFAAVKGKEGRSAFLNFLMQISPACDCYAHSDAPIVRDLGVLASTDPVAIDQASLDLVNRQKGLEGTALTANQQPGEDKFRGLYPKVDSAVQLDHAEKIGLGSRDYELVTL